MFSVRIVPALQVLGVVRKQRRCTTSVSCSFSATNFRVEPRAYSSSLVRSTISRHDAGVIEKGWSGSFAPVVVCCEVLLDDARTQRDRSCLLSRDLEYGLKGR